MRVLHYVAGGLIAAVLLYVLSVGPVLAFVAIRSNFHPSVIRDTTDGIYKPLVIGCYFVPDLQMVLQGYYQWSVRTMQPFVHPKPGMVEALEPK